MADESSREIVPETHEIIRQEDIDETLKHLSDSSNMALPRFTQEHIDWIKIALNERRSLCKKQYKDNGSVDEPVTRRLRELDEQINGVAPEILKVLHFLSRIRAIIPALIGLQEAVVWRTGPVSPEPADHVQFDFTQILLDELNERGLQYGMVAQTQGIDAELTGFTTPPSPANPTGVLEDIRLTDQDPWSQ